MTVETGYTSETILCSQATFRGESVFLTDCETLNCDHSGLEVMHHHDDEGKHYCPTGFIMCHECGGVGDEPEPYECTGRNL